MSSGHNGHSVPNNRGTRNNRRGRNGPQHVPAPPRGPQATTLAPAPRQAPKAPSVQPVNQRPPQPNRGAPPLRENGRQQNGHTPTAPNPRQSPTVTRPLVGSAPTPQQTPQPTPKVAEPHADAPATSQPTAPHLNGHAEIVEIVEATRMESRHGDVTREEIFHADVTHLAASRVESTHVEARRVEMMRVEASTIAETFHAAERPRAPQVERARTPMTRVISALPEYEGDDTPQTGVQPVVRPPRPERTTRDRERYQHVPGTVDVRGDVGPLIDDLHAIFERDRAVASQGNTARCGVCYFHYPTAELVYRDAEGFYLCPNCERSLGSARIVMLRKQQRG